MGLSRGKLLGQSTNGPHHRFLDFGLGERGFAALGNANINRRDELDPHIFEANHRFAFSASVRTRY